MKRAAFETRVQELLDRRQSPSTDVDLARAAAADPELRQLLQAFELFGALRRPCPAAPDDLAEKVVAVWRDRPAARSRSTPSWLAPLVAVAATLLMATTVSLLVKDADQGATRTPGDGGPLAETEQPQSPGLNRLTLQAAHSYRELAATTGASLSSALSVMRPSQAAQDENSRAARSHDDWLRSVPDGLRPLSNSTSDAVYSLLRVVPGADDADRDGL